MSFFKSRPTPAPVSQAPETGTAATPPHPSKPTGQFSPKQIRAFVVVGAVLLLFFIITTGQPTKPKSGKQKQGQDAATTAGNPLALGSRDYANAVTQALKPIPGATGYQYPNTQNQPPYPGGMQPSAQFGQPQGGYGQYPPAGYPIPYSLTNQQYPAGQPYPGGGNPQYSPSSRVPSGQGAAQPPRDPQQEAKEAMQVGDDKREHDSLSAGLIVKSDRVRRDGSPAPVPSAAPAPSAAPTPSANVPFPPAAATIAQPVSQGSQGGRGTAAAASSQRDDLPSHDSQAHKRQQTAANHATGPAYKLFEGTLLETVLTNRLNSSFTGPVTCMVTTDIWSHSRQHLLIPQGTKVLGEARRVTHVGQDRLAVIFHRLIMPDGYSVSLDNFTGLSQIGETGLSDKVNHHYLQIFGVSAALGAISGLAIRGANAGGLGATQSGSDAFRQGFSQQLSQEGTQILDRFLNVLPTVIIREGVRVKVYLLDDLSLPAYDQHRMAADL